MLCIVSQLVCVAILIYFMYHTLNFYAICFLKFIIHTRNSKMVKSEMVIMIERENANVANVDVAVG
jgi:hypothetical protein